MAKPDFVKVRSGDRWAWRWRGWTSPAFPYLEDRPWTPTVIGGRLCFVACNNPSLNDPFRHVPFIGEKWCVVWGDRLGPWFDDLSNLADCGGEPIYVARESKGTVPHYLVVWGDRRSQEFGYPIAYEVTGAVVMVRRFDPRGGAAGPAVRAIWQDLPTTGTGQAETQTMPDLPVVSTTDDSGHAAMIAEGLYDYLIEEAFIRTVEPLLIPDGDVIRLYNHFPTPKVTWWEASVPLTRQGPNRRLLVQSMAFDVEMSKTEFLDAIEELDQGRGGITLVQSRQPLPPDLHPGKFRSQETFLRVLRDCGACLLYELPHQREIACLTVFGRKNFEYLTANGLIDVDNTE